MISRTSRIRVSDKLQPLTLVKSRPAPKALYPRAIIFDCDGVLVDSWYSTCAFYNSIRKGLDLPTMSPEEESFVFVATIEEGMKRIIPEDRMAEAWALKEKFDFTDLLPLIEPQAGVHEFLAFLLANGIKTAVNTNGGHENRLILQSLGLDIYFHAIMTADDVTQPKPGTEAVEKILKRFDLTVEQAVFLGDSIADEETARNSGLEFWAFNNRILNADRYVDDFHQLTVLVSNMLHGTKKGFQLG